MSKLLLGGIDVGGEEAAKGVSFDGVSDYLSRGSDLVGNTDSKTFTFSAWIYVSTSGQKLIYTSDSRFIVQFINNETIAIQGRNSSNTIIFNVIAANLKLKTSNSVVLSCNLANASERHLYINDVPQSPTWYKYTNDFVDFKTSNHRVSGTISNTLNFKGRLSNLFLAYDYIDLSIEANRRLFITEDLKPADNQESLNPIIYLPMDSSDTAHINLGTGGDFTPNGVLDTAQRGANQNNCVQSLFDNSNDFLSKTGFGGSPSTQLLVSVVTKAKESETLNIVGTRPITLQHIPASKIFRLMAYNSSNTLILSADIPINSASINIEYSLAVSLDLSNSSNRSALLNGIDVTPDVTWNTYTNDNIEFEYSGAISIGSAGSNQEIGELYIDSQYVSDLTSLYDYT